jgi:hypothetical protein
MSVFYDDIKDQLLNQRNSLQKTDLKIIDSEIETFECLIIRHNKFLSIIKSINLRKYLIDFNKIDNFVDFIKTPLLLQLQSRSQLNSNEINKKSLVRKRTFDFNSNEIIFEPKIYKLINYDSNIFTHLIIDTNKYLNCLNQMNSITHIIFGHRFDFDIKGCLPNSLIHLIFGHKFNQNIKDCIPKSVTHLHLGHDFDHNLIDCIPDTVTHLTINSYYIKMFNVTIPRTVTHLTFGYNFFHYNKDIKDCIPDSVTHLDFGFNFDQDIKDCIPSSVTHLTFGYRFNQDVKNSIPKTVMYVRLENNDRIDINDFPKDIKVIKN